MMNCDDSRTYLSAYLDDELGIAENLLVQKHLSRCEDCRRTQNQQQALRTALRDPDFVAHPSADFSKRLQGSASGRQRGSAGAAPFVARNIAIWILQMGPRRNRPGIDGGDGSDIRDEPRANFPRPAHGQCRTRRPYSFAPGQSPD